jgi:hypothetical protein
MGANTWPCNEGLQLVATPIVPCVNATILRPDSGTGPSGTMIIPLTAVGLPSKPVD